MISVVLPTWNRAHLFPKAIDSFKAAFYGELEIVLVLTEGDDKSLEVANALGYKPAAIVPKGYSGIQKANIAAKAAKYEWLYAGSDDHWLSPDTLSIAMRVPNRGFFAINDGLMARRRFSSHWLLTKDWCRKYQGGAFIVPHYRSWGADMEIYQRAQRSNTFLPLWTEPSIHNHYTFDPKVERDETYIYGAQFHQADMELYHRREAQNFPDDFEPYF